MQKLILEGETLLRDTVSAGYVVIRPGAAIRAPEGKLVTMTYNGVNLPPAPGVYEGDVVFTVTDRIPLGTYPFRAGLCVIDGRVVDAMSVKAALTAGEYDDQCAVGLRLESREENFNGLYIGGDSQYTVKDADLYLEGNGGNDFVGFGAGVFLGDDACLHIDNSRIRTYGAARGTIFLAGNSTLEVTDSEIESRNGVLPADYIDTVTPGVMRAVPWMLGLHGNCRCFNLAESATAHFRRCKMRSEGWGVMSTDGVRVGRLYFHDSDIAITGASGYGAFSINDCVVDFENTLVDVPDVALIVANGKASGRFHGNTKIQSRRFGVMVFRNTAGTVQIEPGVEFRTGEEIFLVKGCTPEIHASGAVLQSASGNILTLMDMDDPNDTKAYICDPEGNDIPLEGRDLTTEIPGTDVLATFEGMELTGDIYNCTTNQKMITGILDPNEPDAPSEPPYSGGPGSHKGPSAGGPGGPGGAPGGAPGSPGGGPGEMPEFFKKMMGLDKPQVKNLSITLTDTSLTGVISAAKARHRVDRITKYNREELGEIVKTPSEPVNNGVIVNLRGNSVWTVTGTCYLTKLTRAAAAVIQATPGRSLQIECDGTPVSDCPEQLTGLIKIVVT